MNYKPSGVKLSDEEKGRVVASVRAGVKGETHSARARCRLAPWTASREVCSPRAAGVATTSGGLAHPRVTRIGSFSVKRSPAAFAREDDAETWRFCTDATLDRFCKLANYDTNKARR